MPSPSEPPPALELTRLWSQLSNGVNRSAYEDTVVWAIFGTFWAANALLLVALFSQGDFPRRPVIGVIISTAGSVVSVAWSLIQGRAISHLARYEFIVGALEEELRIPERFRLQGDQHREKLQGLGARKVMRGITQLAVVAWTAGLVCFAVSAIFG